MRQNCNKIAKSNKKKIKDIYGWKKLIYPLDLYNPDDDKGKIKRKEKISEKYMLDMKYALK